MWSHFVIASVILIHGSSQVQGKSKKTWFPLETLISGGILERQLIDLFHRRLQTLSYHYHMLDQWWIDIQIVQRQRKIFVTTTVVYRCSFKYARSAKKTYHSYLPINIPNKRYVC